MTKPHPPAGLSIGALSKATGIPVPTLRTWERRYGVPSAQRLPSGHRRYALETVASLERVRSLLDRGHRPSDVLVASETERRAMLELTGRSSTPGDGPGAEFDAWFEAVRASDSRALTRMLEVSWSRHGYLAFLDHHLAPFLVDVGRRWANNDFEIGDEHFLSSLLQDFLADKRRQAHPVFADRTVVCATLPEEQHLLGLHMAAAVLAHTGWAVSFLGSDTPPAAISHVVQRIGAHAVCIGSSPYHGREQLVRQLGSLVQRVQGVSVWVGGCTPGQDLPEDVVVLRDMRHLAEVAG